ncbi:MAG: BMP family ABC transporter substrate-binding protein [Clostridia bacterium]|nr:BMP family ABC transporter substrate-binding protein [Clostridia bacterium]
MKKLICAVLAFVLLLALVACGEAAPQDDKKVQSIDEVEKTVASAVKKVSKEEVKIGLICLHDENSTYDNNFIQALKDAQAELGLSNDQVLIKTGINEDDACLKAAQEFVDAGCNIIFADSFGHETYMIQAAKEFPDVQFCHATGTKAQISGVPNYHTAFADIYEGRFLAGVAAGMKLQEMIDSGKITADKAVIGYIGAFDYAEVVSGMTSFFLGARYICNDATMKVTYTNSWFDIAKEKEAALNLINSGCVLISQHADSEGAPKACEEKGVPNVAYNISTISMGPNTAIISSKINWTPYFKMIINAALEGGTIPTDFCGTMKDGYVELTELNTAVAAEGTQAKLDEVKAKLISGELEVYDTKTFTVNGQELTTYKADIVDNGDFVPDSEAVKNGVFTESSDRSAPYFDIKYIDGISE